MSDMELASWFAGFTGRIQGPAALFVHIFPATQRPPGRREFARQSIIRSKPPAGLMRQEYAINFQAGRASEERRTTPKDSQRPIRAQLVAYRIGLLPRGAALKSRLTVTCYTSNPLISPIFR